MITAPFLLPSDRAKLIEKLASKSSAPHGAMGGEKPAAAPDTEAVWHEALQAFSASASATPPASSSEARGTRHEAPPFILYLHVPFCVSRCVFCGFYRHQCNDEAMENYTQHLLKEIDRVADTGAFAHRRVDIVYFGGGTPTALSADQLRRLITRLHERFDISPSVEFTIEGRIYQFDDERVRACVDSGANRFSFGVQSFETALRQELGRRNTREELLERLRRIKDICGDRAALVADLIYGLPGQSQEDWMERNVKTTHVESALDGVDIYSLKVFPGLPLEKLIEKHGAWSEEERLRRHAEAADYLESAGWTQLSTTHFGRNSLERNLYNHWALSGGVMLPFGAGAGGNLGGYAIMQTGELEKYLEMVDKGLKPIGMCMKTPPMMQVRSILGGQLGYGWFDPATMPKVDYAKLCENWETAGVWRRQDDGKYRLTRLGEYFQPKVLSMLMGYTMANSMSLGDAAKMMLKKITGK